MVRLITMLLLCVCTALSAQSQYEQGMKKAFGLWDEGKSAEASSLFERIASAEKNNWLPEYYVALVNTTEAFRLKDKEKVNALLTKAQAAQDKAAVLAPDNAEVLVMQAMIYTAYIASDPMTNGMKLSGMVNELYAKAQAIAPNNPRVVFGKAEFSIGSARYFGQDTKPMCADIERAVGLFAAFKPESAFHPKWGLERAQQALAECKK
jgi:hypothetical protein